MRWLSILLGIWVFSYQFATPLLVWKTRRTGKSTKYLSVRLGVTLWLFMAALFHTPPLYAYFGAYSEKSKYRDPSRVFASMFIIIAFATLSALTAFACFYYMIKRLIYTFKPNWYPQVFSAEEHTRGVKAFWYFIKSSVMIATSLSLFYVYCIILTENKESGMREGYIYELCFYCVEGVNVIKEKESDMIISYPQTSPVTYLWISLVLAVALYFALTQIERTNRQVKRFLRVKQNIQKSPVPTNLPSRKKKENVVKWLRKLRKSGSQYIVTLRKSVRREESVAGLIEKIKETEAHEADKMPKFYKVIPDDFLPMTEWYSVQLAELAVQMFIQFKLFFNRFDPRVLQASFEPLKPVHVVRQTGSSAESQKIKNLMKDVKPVTNEDDTTDDNDLPPASSSCNFSLNGPECDGDFADNTELVFDWMADTGDGGNPTYAVARAMAQPELKISNIDNVDIGKFPHKSEEGLSLERAKVMIIGGDLSYPSASIEEYKNRLHNMFDHALECPVKNYDFDIAMKGDNILNQLTSSLSKPKLSKRRSSFFQESQSVTSVNAISVSDQESIKSDSDDDFLITGKEGRSSSSVTDENLDVDQTFELLAPLCYAIPGNHDWYDGLYTFTRCILSCNWLGGWFLPQKRSYFALKLPHNWWFFGLDYALTDDIDVPQYQYFSTISKHFNKNTKVILGSHEPTWLLDAYEPTPQKSSPNVERLINVHLHQKVKIKIAGDVHSYIHHISQPQSPRRKSKKSRLKEHLIVSGGGGAFLHPTHTFPKKFEHFAQRYSQAKCYPDENVSRSLSANNLGLGFRQLNWKVDGIFAILYFFLVLEFFPRCTVQKILDAPNYYPSGVTLFLSEIFYVIAELFTSGTVSFLAFFMMFLSMWNFSDTKHGALVRLLMAVFHALAHLFCAVFVFQLLELYLQIASDDKLAGEGYSKFIGIFTYLSNSLWFPSYIKNQFQTLILPGLQMTLQALDLPETMAATRLLICEGHQSKYFENWFHRDVTQMGFESLTRSQTGLYYLGNFLYLFILSADMAASVFGFYLFVSVYMLDMHWNEAFSSIRNEHFKHFIRFLIDKQGDLHCFVIGMDRVPKFWRKDVNYTSILERQIQQEILHSQYVSRFHSLVCSGTAKFPSKYISDTKSDEVRETEKPKLVEYFRIDGGHKPSRPKLSKSNKSLHKIAPVVVSSGLGKMSREGLTTAASARFADDSERRKAAQKNASQEFF